MKNNYFPYSTGEFMRSVDKKMNLTKKTAFRYHRLDHTKKRYLTKKLADISPRAKTVIWTRDLALRQSIKSSSSVYSKVSNPQASTRVKARQLYDKIFKKAMKNQLFDTMYPKTPAEYFNEGLATHSTSFSPHGNTRVSASIQHTRVLSEEGSLEHKV